MKFYFAPMEGITGYIFRNAHHTYFNHIDKYYSPFIVANQSGELKSKCYRDILPENNQGLVLIPQLLTNHAKDFICASEAIKQLGYKEINLNLGCPSGTVVAKGKGAGFLAHKEALDRFLDEIYMKSITDISIKTRIGKDDPEEFYQLIELYNKYPVKELIIHPRIQTDYYKNQPNLNVFADAMRLSKNPVCYNGDIHTIRDYQEFISKFPEVKACMLGRGLIANPGLIDSIMSDQKMKKETLRKFHDQILEGYRGVLFGDRNVLFKMKEIWFYLISSFTNSSQYEKRIKKSERLRDYEEAISSLFREQELIN